jgi:hypothetical protein
MENFGNSMPEQQVNSLPLIHILNAYIYIVIDYNGTLWLSSVEWESVHYVCAELCFTSVL